MSTTTRATCLNCGRHKSEAGPISWGGYCGTCGPLLHIANNDQLHEGNGPFYVHWARRSFMASRKRLLAAERSGGGGVGGVAERG